jgi:hypothetical protein
MYEKYNKRWNAISNIKRWEDISKTKVEYLGNRYNQKAEMGLTKNKIYEVIHNIGNSDFEIIDDEGYHRVLHISNIKIIK